MTVTTLPTVTAPPALVVDLDGKQVPMTVRTLEVDVAIAGLVARTTMQMTFENPHERDLEGELTFPLPEGAALAGYALDVEGVLVDASLVEKKKARVVFEAEVRKGVDPGLVERIAGNQFRTRIWPVPSKGTRTIKVTYVSALGVQDGSAVYDLPLKFEPPQQDAHQDQAPRFAAWGALFGPQVPQPTGFFASLFGSKGEPGEPFRMRVTVAKGPAAPAFQGAEQLGFEDRGQAWVAELRSGAGVPDRVRVGLAQVAGDLVTVERQDDGEHHFRIDVRIEDDQPPAALEPERVALVWDGSFSRATQDKQREFDLLRALFKRWGTVTVDLFVLRDAVEEAGSFSMVLGECEPLLETLAQVPCDGGTRIGALAVPSGYDACLLFSDGLSTLGDELPGPIDAPVYVVSAAPTVNAPLLRHLAEGGGGVWLDLTRVHPEEAAGRIGVEGLTLLGVEFAEGAIADVLPSGRRAVEGGAVGVSGRLLSDAAEVTLRFGRGTTETARRTFELSRAEASATGLVGRLWAQGRVDELALRGERFASEMLDLGRRFGIVTPNTSFLVLETLEQHLEHEIPPAPTRTKMRKAYDRRVGDQRQDEEQRRERKLDQVHGWWKDLVAWWEKEYDPAPPPIAEEDAKLGGGPPGGLGGMPDAAPAAMMMDLGMEEEASMELAEPMPMPMPVPASAPPPRARMQRMIMEDRAPSKKSKAISGDGATVAGITVKPWDPDTPYLAAMKEAGDEDAYATFLAQRAEHGTSPSFYLDCASHLFRLGERALGLRVLGNVAELELENPQLLRIVGYKLETEGELKQAAELLDRVRVMRPEEPQSYRDLALVLDRLEDYRHAAELLWQVVWGEWDGRFPEIETIALMELNRVLERAKRAGQPDLAQELGIDPRFLKVLDLDMRIVLAWDADLTDVDLWVIEPNQEKCFYSHNLTRMGGRMSRDFTQGYGPEVYTLRKGMQGAYTIQANYYGSSQQSLTGPATVLATVFTHFARPEEERQTLTLRVTEVKDVVDVGEVSLG